MDKMSKYKYTIRDYHAIKEAVIELNGITVLAGVNGCGKSTLSRWLYYLIEGSNEYDQWVFIDYKNKLINGVRRMRMVCGDLERFMYANKHVEVGIAGKLREIMEKIRFVEMDRDKETAQDLFLQAVDITGGFLKEVLAEKNMAFSRRERAFRYLNIIQDGDEKDAVNDFIERNSRFVLSLTKKVYQEIEKRSIDIFFDLIRDNFEIDDKPSSIQLEEDGVSVIENHISTLFDLQHAIYVDTPMAIEAEETDNVFWRALQEMLIREGRRNLSVEEKKFLWRIKDLLRGETVLNKDEFEEKSLRYISNDKKINIELKDVATGFKAFSYLQRLLENGFLTKGTLLMIDEPEAHLHPQWVVEFARLLVLLNKEMDLKIMIASHNPDMVAAIHDIADKEGILDNTTFYVAQQDEESLTKYVYKNLKHEIGEIFESFNIAIENIKRYGTMGV